MIIDTSAIIAILQNEHDYEKYAQAIYNSQEKYISSVNYFEAKIVMIGKKIDYIQSRIDILLIESNIEVYEVNQNLANIAAKAYEKYGKGRHKAALNFADCFSYALAKHMKMPLLFKGDDFSLTDVKKVKIFG